VSRRWQHWRTWVASHIDEDAQVYRQYQATPQSMWMGLAVGLALAVFLWGQVPASRIVGWLAVYVVLFAVRMALRRRFMALQPKDEALHQWAAVLVALIALSGLLWASTVPLFRTPQDSETARMTLYVLGGSALAGLPMYANFFPALVTYISAMLLVAAVFFAMQGGTGYFSGFLSFALWVIFMLQGRRQGHHMRQLVRMRLEKEQLAQQLQTENLAKEAALAQAHAANATKTRLFSAISHDVRQPMSALALLADAAQRSQNPAHRDQLLAQMQRSVEVVNDLFTQVLELSQLDSGRVEMEMRPVAVHALLGEVAQLFTAQVQQSGHQLSLQCQPLWVLADRACLQRVVLNLLGNALHHTPACALVLSAQPEGDEVVLTVRDEGPGIAIEKQAMIFEEFYKGAEQRHGPAHAVSHAVADQAEPAVQGRNFGLGLAIARRLARAMGSDLQLVSAPGQGSAFSLRLRAVAAPAGAAALPPSISQPTPSLLQGARVGIVDDDELSGQALVSWLQSSGAQPLWARNAPQALAWAPQDAVVVDYQLGAGPTGAELIAQLQSLWGSHTPALLVSGVQPPAEALQGLDFVPKPLTAMKLRAWLLHAVAQTAKA
jgi:two-component system, sensor histidine kinase